MNEIKKPMADKGPKRTEKMKKAQERVAEILKRIKQPAASRKKFIRVSTKGTWTKMSVVSQSATYPTDEE
jgi:exopolyphosphatase/pppGpp-phosphohydrolase